MDAAIAAVLRQAAAAIGEPARAAQVVRVASEARAGDLAYLSGDDSDDLWLHADGAGSAKRGADAISAGTASFGGGGASRFSVAQLRRDQVLRRVGVGPHDEGQLGR